MTVTGLQLGAPGVYRVSTRQQPSFQPIRLDVAGFVGVAPRGPVDQPVAVDSWSDYLWRFGGYDGPGLLPWAVHAFFTQGGTRAYVCRVSPIPRSPSHEEAAACALHRLALGTPADGAAFHGLDIAARDEGSWGGGLGLECAFSVGQRYPAALADDVLVLPRGSAPPAGTLMRIRVSSTPGVGDYYWVEELTYRDVDGIRQRVARVAPVSTAAAAHGSRAVEVEVITAVVTVADDDPTIDRRERFTELGMRNDHPRYLPCVLRDESLLVTPSAPWPDALLPPDHFLSAVGSSLVRAGADRWPGIGPDSFIGDVPVDLLPVGGVEPADDALVLFGADLMALVPEVALLTVPDLFWDYAEPPAHTDPPQRPRPSEFAPCPVPVPELTYPAAPPAAVRLDARQELDEILRRQGRLVDLAERQQRFVALLDVPERLTVDGITRWRAHFDSSFAAAYHPWLGVLPDQGVGPVVLIPPSALAAGIIAEREQRLGISWGPANTVAAGAVVSEVVVSDSEHDGLHALDIDVFRAERDGYRLTAAHTLSRDPDYLQLSVRRLMTLLRLVLYRQSQWLVFEPNTPQLRRQLLDAIIHLLRDLYRAGAFAGDTEADSFFVRCDEAVNPAWSQDLGRLVAEVGVAPASPLEYLMLRISQDADGTVRMEG